MNNNLLYNNNTLLLHKPKFYAKMSNIAPILKYWSQLAIKCMENLKINSKKTIEKLSNMDL